MSNKSSLPSKPVRPVVDHSIGERNGKRSGTRFYTARKDVVEISNHHHPLLPFHTISVNVTE